LQHSLLAHTHDLFLKLPELSAETFFCKVSVLVYIRANMI
jgi:hypothetical protein